MSDTVERIEWRAFDKCTSSVFVKLSRNLKFIDGYVFQNCTFLEAMYIPQSCVEVHTQAFYNCKRLKLLIASWDAVHGDGIVRGTALIEASPFEKIAFGEYDTRITTHEQVNEWIRNLNHEEIYSLHVLVCGRFACDGSVVRYLLPKEPNILISENRSVWRGLAPNIVTKGKALYFRGSTSEGVASIFSTGKQTGSSWTIISDEVLGKAESSEDAKERVLRALESMDDYPLING
ncbi:FAD/NAD(P)-binding domain-containing protein [Chaetoceros tenuissimus]|uniref:FAD/NAD(P)-binding domain-containing protein n=1 Tax=Chaetoceros tenuissimus TaxID=426638 RepID=A0AAD3HB27_9STRA|nr:FAD/NAD(P)-binding domain-containing protein [Chaetoceros tenuissimus]